MKNLIKRFIANEDGNVAIMFGMTFIGSFLAVGAAIDIALMQKNKVHLQRISDTAALAAVNFRGSDAEKIEAFNEYLKIIAAETGYTNEIVATNVGIDSDTQKLTFTTALASKHNLMFLNNLYEIDGIKAASEVEAGIEDVEVVLTIDISSSMSGARIIEAKKSAEFFVRQVLANKPINGDISVSLVPFGGTVRVPVELGNLLKEPDEGFEDYSEYWIDEKWNQCFEYTSQQLRDGISDGGSSSSYDDSGSEVTSFGGAGNNGIYEATPDFWSWNSNNPWCPREGNEFVPLTDDAEALATTIQDLTLSDGTGSDHGMFWSYENLNSARKNQFPGGMLNTPTDDVVGTRKIIVFMTDGGITAQHELRDEYKTGSPPFNSRRKQLISYNNSLTSFYTICDKAKADNIEVFTIGYNLRKDHQETQLKTCATSPSHYLDAFSGNLESVFEGIASAIAPVRIKS